MLISSVLLGVYVLPSCVYVCGFVGACVCVRGVRVMCVLFVWQVSCPAGAPVEVAKRKALLMCQIKRQLEFPPIDYVISKVPLSAHHLNLTLAGRTLRKTTSNCRYCRLQQMCCF